MKPVAWLPAVFLLIAGSALANDPHQPTRQQLDEMLRGNSMQGIWAGTPYLQYFDPSGNTRYRERGANDTEGRWRIDENGRYCSIWPPSDRWVCYQVLVVGNSVYWKSGDQYYPAEVKPGNAFDAE